MKGQMSWPILLAVAMSCGWPLPSTAEIHEVTVQNFNFSPNDLTIQAGDTVRWTNADGFHDVTEDNFSWASATGFDWVYEREFGQTGVVLYHCSVHSGPGQPIQTSMNGRITIEAPAEQPLFADGFE
jgi:plastocyanin